MNIHQFWKKKQTLYFNVSFCLCFHFQFCWSDCGCQRSLQSRSFAWDVGRFWCVGSPQNRYCFDCCNDRRSDGWRSIFPGIPIVARSWSTMVHRSNIGHFRLTKKTSLSRALTMSGDLSFAFFVARWLPYITISQSNFSSRTRSQSWNVKNTSLSASWCLAPIAVESAVISRYSCFGCSSMFLERISSLSLCGVLVWWIKIFM